MNPLLVLAAGLFASKLLKKKPTPTPSAPGLPNNGGQNTAGPSNTNQALGGVYNGNNNNTLFDDEVWFQEYAVESEL